LGGKGLKMCVTKVWGVLGDTEGLNPGFTHFRGFRGGILGRVYLAILLPTRTSTNKTEHHHYP
jgi:hypothetical protein